MKLPKGIILNPNEKVVQRIRKGLKRNNGYCPCNQGDTPIEDTLCPCKKFKEEQKCCCNLYIKKENGISKD